VDGRRSGAAPVGPGSRPGIPTRWTANRGDKTMDTPVSPVRIGEKVPDATLDYFDPTSKSFGQISFEQIRSQGKWTILFFYPADFTFV
jgi:hypothetical protein